jgi:hypothetical protein
MRDVVTSFYAGGEPLKDRARIWRLLCNHPILLLGSIRSRWAHSTQPRLRQPAMVVSDLLNSEADVARPLY